MNVVRVVAFLAGCTAGAAIADDRANPLAGLPSRPGESAARLAALGDDEWIVLGQAAADPQWGVARGRAWCSKMAFAPDLGGAFLCGTGVHGATPDGRYMDDLWFYDARAHRWICLYPGADPKSLALRRDARGFEVDAQGRDVPVSYLSHAYCNTTYNTDLRLYHVVWTQCPWWSTALPQRWEWLDQTDPGVKARTYGNVGPVISAPKHPLFWNVGQAEWQRKFVEGPGPAQRFEGVVEYVPSLRKTVYTHRGTTWLYDYAKNSWSQGAKVPEAVAAYDSNGCLDPRRERIYVARGKGFAVYDARSDEWRVVQAAGQPDDLRSTSGAQLHFDAANDVVLWHRNHGGLAVFDPRTESWRDLGNKTPPIPWKRFKPDYMCTHGFYDPGQNVHFFYLAGDSNHTDATLLAYRYRRADGGDEKRD